MTDYSKEQGMACFVGGVFCPSCGKFISPVPVSPEVRTSEPPQYVIQCQACLRKFWAESTTRILGGLESNRLLI